MTSGPQQPPYSTYAALVGIFGLGMGGLAGVASLRGRRPEQLRPLDLVVLSAATFKAARTVAHDEVLSFLREPFVQGEAHEETSSPSRTAARRGDRRAAHLQPLHRHVGGRGRLVGLHVVAPRSGRLLTWSLAASAANDFLQAELALAAKANQLERQAG